MARDFSPCQHTRVGTSLQEGSYAVMVTVKSSFNAGGFYVHCCVGRDQLACNWRPSGSYSSSQPARSSLQAAPACDNGSIYVKFRPVSDTNDLPWKTTNTLTCAHGQSRNFLVAGMLAQYTLRMAHVAAMDLCRLR